MASVENRLHRLRLVLWVLVGLAELASRVSSFGVQQLYPNLRATNGKARESKCTSFPVTLLQRSQWKATTSSCRTQVFRHFSSSSTSSTTSNDGAAGPTTAADTDMDVSTWRVSTLKTKLDEMSIDYSDCFDKESLIQRLKDAQNGTFVARTSTSKVATAATTNLNATEKQATEGRMNIDRDAIIAELRALSVRRLREECAQRQIRWAGLLEKEDLVQAITKARLEAAVFSATGELIPGQVVDLTGEQLLQEIRTPQPTPLLVDVYATWCGPCHLLAPQLKEVAAILGDRVRVAKMDSDRAASVSSQLRVQGLPSLILFKNGQEVDRVEGALMKDQLLDWIHSKI